MSPSSKTSESSAHLLSTLEKLARRRSVGDRVEFLREHESMPLLKRILWWTYNPYIRFGVSVTSGVYHHLQGQIDPAIKKPLQIADEEIWDTLKDLSNSTASSSSKVAILEKLFQRMDYATAHIVLGILKKNVARGVAASTVNKAWEGFIPSFKVQLAAKYSDRKAKNFPLHVEPKYDGMRALTIVHLTGEVEFCTRTGRPIPAAAYFHDDVLKMAESHRAEIEARGETYHGTLFDGEVIGETFNDTVSTFRSNATAESGHYMVFDVLPLDVLSDKDCVSGSYLDRRGMLERVMGKYKGTKCKMSPSYQVGSKAEIWSLYNKARELGYEGLIVKEPEGTWQGKRSNDWLKIKSEETLDLQIVGGFEGEGELEGTLGGIIVDFEGTQVRVGSGFTRRDRDLLYGDFLRDLERARKGEDDFELFGCSAEVQYQEITKDKSLRHPVFIRLRRDKDEVQF